jgi:hypothetical protein
MLRQCSTPLVRSALIAPQWQQLAAAAVNSLGSWPCSAGSWLQASTAAAGRSYSAAGMPANAMDLIKELRKTSGAPISDVKVQKRCQSLATAMVWCGHVLPEHQAVGSSI